MSERFPVNGMHRDSANGVERRQWIAPTLAAHTTLTTLTQTPLHKPLNLLFLQSSIQCFDHNGNPVPCT